MHTHQIRQQIARAVIHEQQTDTLASLLAQHAMQLGRLPHPAGIAQIVAFVRDYVEHAPVLLDAATSAAAQAGIAETITPLLDAAARYFLDPYDFIPDHNGLVGLMDDAYLTHGLLQAASDQVGEQTGIPLLATDLSTANYFIRELIGEPMATQLDASVTCTLQQVALQRSLEAFAPAAHPFVVEDPVWKEDDWEDRLPLAAFEEPSSADLMPPEEDIPDWRSNAQVFFRTLHDKYQQEIDTGTIGGARKEALDGVLKELEHMLHNKPDDLAGMMTQAHRLRALMSQMGTAVEQPSHATPSPSPGARPADLHVFLGGLKRFLMNEVSHFNLAEGEHEQLQALYGRCAKAEQQIRALRDNEATRAFERETFRKLALDVRAFALRHHLTFATPIWPAPRLELDANALFYAGPARTQALLQPLCRDRGMKWLDPDVRGHYAQARWDQLRRCNIAIFHLTAAPGPALSGTCYELGIALALGKSVVIAAEAGTRVPFDVDVTPVWLEGTGEDGARLAEAIDDALYTLQRDEHDSSLAATIRYAQKQLGNEPSWQIRQTLALFDDEETTRDPSKAHALLENLVGFAGPSAPTLLFPAWRGRYPAPNERRCFHVMAFGHADWSEAVMQITAATCRAAGVAYVRGDHVADPNVIRSIWDEISRATHVVVDLTHFNPNVALELGLAHTLGRPTLVVGEVAGTARIEQWLFPSITKRRVYPYDAAARADTLQRTLNRFLQAAPDPDEQTLFIG